ncbi:MAG: sulfite exporter TauE/SafE family protein [Syntrophobacteraceae bacterium]
MFDNVGSGFEIQKIASMIGTYHDLLDECQHLETSIQPIGYLYICGIAALAGFIQGLSGFGSVIVSIPLFVLFLDIKTVIPFANILALVLSLYLFIQLHRHFLWKEVAPLLLASLPGISSGVYILKMVEAWLLELIIALVLLGFSFHYLLATRPKRQVSAHWAWVAGFLSGCLGGSIGMIGPPVIIYSSLQPWGKNTTKSTLVAYFLVAGVGISFLHAATGLLTGEVLKLDAIALPAFALGAFTGTFCYARIGAESFKKVVTLLILVLGIVTLWKALMRH